MKFRLKDARDIDAFLTGCAFYGTGGGGDTKIGRISLVDCLDKGLEIVLADPSEIQEEGLYCHAFFMGSIAPKTPEVLAEMERNGYADRLYDTEEMLIGAVQNLEAHLGRKVDALVVAEPGGTNAACCMAAAYKMGVPVIDGDPAGRAIPSMTNGLACVRGYDCLPATYFDAWGNCNITTDAFDYRAIERIGKFLSQASYGEMAEAAYPMSGIQLRNVLVPNSLSRCLSVGKAIDQAKEEGRDLLHAAAKASGGKVVGRGIVSDVRPVDEDSYYQGTYLVQGEGAYSDKTFKIWFKNENHILWVNGVPIVTSPDLITIVNYETGMPVLNTFLTEGEPVGIIISPCHEFYREEASIKAFGPRAFGFDFDYLSYDSVEDFEKWSDA